MIIDGREFDRTQGIGGSDVPIIVGMSPYRSALDLWAEKRGDTIDREPTIRMRIGSMLEDGIARLYAEQEGAKLVKPTLPYGLRYDDFGGLRPRELVPSDKLRKQFGFPTWAQVDRRRVGQPVIGVEVKHTAMLERFSGGVPDDVQVQVQHAMMLTGWKAFDVVSLSGGRELAVERITADPDAWDAMVEACRLFWRQVQDGEPPAADGSDAAGRYLRERYNVTDPDKVMVATHDMLPTIVEVLRTADLAKRAEQEHEAAKQRVMQIMEDAERLEAPGGVKITWKMEKGKPSYKQIAADFRRLIEQNGESIDLPKTDDGDEPVPLDEWLDFIESMHVGKPARTMRVSGKLVALEGRKDTE